MSGNQVKTNKYTNTSEALDLRESIPENPATDVKRIELPPLPEQLETIEHNDNTFEDNIEEGSSRAEQVGLGNIVVAGQARQRREIRYREIENVLADGLDDLYLGMDQSSQERFKKAGEEAGKSIDGLILKGRGTAKKIVEIIKKWLSLIPGINKFFLEQEAKIKADKIMNLQKL